MNLLVTIGAFIGTGKVVIPALRPSQKEQS
jgi:hypothetical protein